jgi:membrane protease YdiL (CAAX protease family)
MFKRLTDLSKGAVYYAIAFPLVLAIALFFRADPSSGSLAQFLSMMTPTAAVLLMMLVVTRDGREDESWRDLGLRRSGWRVWVIALFGPALLLTLAYVVLWQTGYATFAVPEGTTLVIVLTAILGSFGGSFLFSFAEELGWRGYLQQRLMPLGARPAVLVTGFLHGLFHMPLLLLTPFYHSAGNKLIVVPLFIGSLTMAGVIYGYLRIVSGSVWPAAIAHSALNTAWQILTGFTAVSSPLAVEYLGGESGLLALIGYVIVAGFCLYLIGHRSRPAVETVAPVSRVAPTPAR